MSRKNCLLIVGMALWAMSANAQTRPITDADALEAGHRVELATNSGNSYQIDHFLVPDSLLTRMRMYSIALKDTAFLVDFRETFIPAMMKYGDQVMATIKGGNYRLMKEYDDHGVKHLLFRMFGLGGLNYHDFILIRTGDTVRAADVYPFTSEEWLSRSIGRMTDMMSNTTATDGSASIVLQLTYQFNKKDYTGVKNSYDKLDKTQKSDKVLEYLYVQACRHIDTKLYEQALDEYTTNFPDAGGGYLQMIDLYLLQKDGPKGLTAIDKLNKLVGGDPFLDFFRGRFYTLSGDSTASLACYERVYQYDPALGVNVLQLTRKYAAANKMDKAKAVIAAYKHTPGYHEGDLDDLYATYPALK
jgi:hypothetical protein